MRQIKGIFPDKKPFPLIQSMLSSKLLFGLADNHFLDSTLIREGDVEGEVV